MNITLEAVTRSKGKKSDMNELRKSGFIPAIIYGDGEDAKLISLDKTEFMKLYRKTLGQLAFFDVNLGKETIKTILKDKQVHPVSRDILHMDFQKLHAGKEITIKIPFRFVGTAPGTKAGGILEILHRDLEVSCLPKDIPDDIEIDLSQLDVGDVIHLKDIDIGNLDTKVEEDTTIATIYMPRLEEEKEEEEELSEEPETETEE